MIIHLLRVELFLRDILKTDYEPLYYKKIIKILQVSIQIENHKVPCKLHANHSIEPAAHAHKNILFYQKHSI
jgi:hypothetical protein